MTIKAEVSNNSPQKSGFNRTSVFILGFVLLLGSLTVFFEYAHITGPSDGARLQPGEKAWHAQGVIVRALTLNPTGLQDGDLITSIEGISIREWVDAQFNFEIPSINWIIGETLTYTVLRDEIMLELPVTLQKISLTPIFREGWGIFLAGWINQIIITIVFLRNPQNPAIRGLFLAISGLFTTRTWSWGLQLSDLVNGSGFWIYQITTSTSYFLIFSGALHFSLTFPRRASILQNRRWLITAIYLAPNAIHFAIFFTLRATSPDTVDWLSSVNDVGGPIQIVLMSAMLLAVAWGYRTTRDPTDRVKVRWILYASFFVGLIALLLFMLPELLIGRAIIGPNELSLMSIFVLLPVLIAIYRHHLFDIDSLINRTAVYLILTSILAVLYLSAVTVLGRLIQSLQGEISGEPSPIAIVSSTIAVVAMFSPLRRRVQNGIDRKFYRSKYDAARTLLKFSNTLRHRLELEELTEVLKTIVADTFQPHFLELWVPERPRANRKPASE